MADLALQRCANHAGREAVARCMGCRRYFCRECVTEHDDRVWCAACLAAHSKPALSRRLRLAGVGRLLLALIGLFALWSFFYLGGRILAALPGTFHEGTYLSRIAGNGANEN
jgi:hypothetical protein